jgi:hypothetical protein
VLKDVDEIFCDGMYFPRTPLTNTQQQVKDRFEDVALVANTVKNSAL